MFVEDINIKEKEVLETFSLDLAKGEWITTDKVKEIFKGLPT
jgi:hypothetical protein